MRATYHPLLVAVSVLVGVGAAYVAAELYAHAGTVSRRVRAAWLGGATAAAALAVWGVHFVGLLSLRLRVGDGVVPIDYDLARMLLPGVVAAAGAGLASAVIVRFGSGLAARLAAGVLLGGGIVGAHYTAMLAIRLAGTIRYAPGLVVASVVVAVVGAVGVAIAAGEVAWTASTRRVHRLAVACLAGGTVVATHYTAVAAARFAPTGGALPIAARHLLAREGVAVVVAVVVLVTLGMALLVLALDRRASAQRRATEQVSARYRDAEAARAAAEESERRFRTLADTGPAMVWVADPAGRRTFVGQRWAEFTGGATHGPDGAGDDWTPAIDPEDRARVLGEYHDALAARRRVRLEYRVRRPDGRCCWVLDTGVPRESAPDAPAGYVGTCIDITERRETEEAQRFLLEAARVVATSLDLDEVLHSIADLLVPRVADYCVVHLREPAGPLRQAIAAHRDPAMTPLLDALGTRADGPNGAESARPALPAPTSEIAVPLVARRELVGTLTLAMSTSGRAFGDRDRALVELFAARAALALDNARLYTEARRARDARVRASDLESQLMRTRLDALRAQLNPHFLFNALNTIAMLVRRQATQDALSGIVNLSDLLRRSLAEQNALLVPLRGELPMLESYVAIEQLRFRDRLRVRFDLAPDTLDALVPGLLLQPLVENAIRHGIARRSEAGAVDVRSRRDGDMLLLEVCDDGPGFPTGWDPATSGGIGLANTRERLERIYGGAFAFEPGSRDGGGARVLVRVPYQPTSPG